MTWPELADLLTRHEIGPKEGTCIVPAIFSGQRRSKEQAQRIDLAFLDSDAGSTLPEIRAALHHHGWMAIISSTHSHLTARTHVKRDHWLKFRPTIDDAARAPAAFLEAEKGYLPRVAQNARLAEETSEFAILAHQPCPKFRIALPLRRPWLAQAYASQHVANADWKERIGALAAALHLDHDQSCTDTSRLFYLPRRAPDGPPAETCVLDGTPCDIFALPSASERTPPAPKGARRPDAGKRRQRGPDDYAFLVPETGERFDLTSWAREHGHSFQIVQALRARKPEVFTGKIADATKHHIRCANEDEHTQAGADSATFVANADTSSSKGFVHHCRHGHCEGRDRLFFVHKMLEQGWLMVTDLHDPRFQAIEPPARPLIRFVPGRIAEIVDEAEAALLKMNPDIYQRGTMIVRTGIVSATMAQNRRIGARRILEVGDHALAEAMTSAANWEHLNRRSRRPTRIDAPLKIVKTYRDRVGAWKLPILAGLINAPTLRADGSVLANPGYDPQTGLLLHKEDETFPDIPHAPTRADAVASLGLLQELLRTFPFVDGASRAVALSAILTACIRRSLATAPMHAFTAPTAGSGKSMLVDLISVIVAGREAGVIAQGKTEEELEKRLGALLLAGDQVIAIDNCEAPLGGEFLCSMLTQRSVRPRILGRSEVPELPSNAFVSATGNNLRLVGDMTRRALLCRLDPEHERPELRKFAANPVKIANLGRARYVVAALTILRAYHVAGRPNAPDPIGSFEDWNWVRGALFWLGQCDPAKTMEQARALDPRLEALTAVLTQWSSVIGRKRVSCGNIIERATRTQTGTSSYTKPEFCHPAFREALLTVAGDAGAVNSRRLGRWISASEQRIVDGIRIVRKGVLGGSMTWQLEQVGDTDAARV